MHEKLTAPPKTGKWTWGLVESFPSVVCVICSYGCICQCQGLDIVQQAAGLVGLWREWSNCRNAWEQVFMSDVGGGRRPADPQTDFHGKPRGCSALKTSCLWLFAADPPSKENPYEDIETNSRCLGKKCVLTFPASPTSSVPGTPTKVLWFKWPPLLLQKVFGWNPGPAWKKWSFANGFHHVRVFSFLSFTTEYSVMRGGLLPYKKVKKKNNPVFPYANGLLTFTFFHPRTTFP